MTERLTRRDLLVRTVGATIGAASLVLLRPAATLAQQPVRGDDLVDEGEKFRRGVADRVSIVATPRGPALQAERGAGVFTSAVLESPIPFTHVGLHWAADESADDALKFELRAGADGSNWSSWIDVDLQRRPEQTPVGDYFGALAYVGRARYVQYRATFRPSGGAGATLRRVTASTIDSPAATTGARLQTVTVPDADSGRGLAVTSREQWGADEGLRFSGTTEVWPEMFVSAKKLVVHHTATRNTYATDAEAAAEVRAIYRYHAVSQQWGDIGYAALVDKFGNVYEGRHGRGEGAGREYLSPGVVAGHALAHNYGSAGVALLGDSTKRDWPMSSASGPMWDSLVRYGVFEAGRHGIRPLRAAVNAQATTADIATSDFLRSDDVWRDAMRNVCGHQEVTSTRCPGTKVMNLLPNLRNAIHAGLADASRHAITLSTTPSGRETRVGATLAASWMAEAPASGWTLVGWEYCVEGWQKPSGSYDVQYLSGYGPEPQRRPIWTRVGPEIAGTTSTPDKPGHYTVHVRAVLRNAAGVERRCAYEANHTYRVI